jgi:hypothetical protein
MESAETSKAERAKTGDDEFPFDHLNDSGCSPAWDEFFKALW